jgi:simple sugar transport system ATP-binding protein
VDIGAKDGIYAAIRKLAAEGIAVIVISDEIPEVFFHTHRVVVMQHGRMTGELTPAQCSEIELRRTVDA